MTRMTRWAGRTLKGCLGALPDFLIVGVQGGGTTSLFAYLNAHPDVHPARRKEIGFFNKHYARGLYWYRSHFPSRFARRLRMAAGSRFLTGDADPAYVLSPHYLQRIARLLPESRLILMLRNPVDRAYSHYHHAVRLGLETLSFAQALVSEDERIGGKWNRMLEEGYYDSALSIYSYRRSSEYAAQVRAMVELFPRERLHIVESERFFADPARELAGVQDFLGLRCCAPDRFVPLNKGNYPPLEPELRRGLETLFAPMNRQLCDLLGLRFGWAEAGG